MSGWILERRSDLRSDLLTQSLPRCIDASDIKLTQFAKLNTAEVNAIELKAGNESIALGDLFHVSKSGDDDTLCMRGDLTRFQYIASEHDRGRFIVEGDVGNYAAARMSGGEFWVTGSAGDYLASASGSHRTGMRGGRIVIMGSARHHVGHRMRRGEIAINGSVGDFLGSHLIAGTILVAQDVGEHVGYAMRRGTLILGTRPPVSKNRFSRPVAFETAFFLLLCKQWQLRDWHARQPQLSSDSIERGTIESNEVNRLLARIVKSGFSSFRGDFAVEGQGEIVFPDV